MSDVEPFVPEIKVFPDVPALATAAADVVAAVCDRAIRQNGVFSIGLSGGSTPEALFERLAEEPHASNIDWPSVDVYFVDERCVPPDHPESNYKTAHETLLSKVPLRPHAVYRMKGELEPDAAAREYGRLLQDKLGDGGLDLCLLGMGADGHTASLFPGTAAVNEAKHRVVANYAEHSTTGKSWRITLTAPFINRSAVAAVLVAGASKAPTVARVLEGAADPKTYPIHLIRPDGGKLMWLMDAAAAGMNEA